MIRNRVLAAIPYSWVVVALVVAITIAIAFTQWGFAALYPFIQEDLHITLAQLGLIASGLHIGGVVTALLAGWLVDVIGARRLMTLGLVMMVVGLLVFSQMRDLVYLFLLAFLIGASFSGSLPSKTKAIMEWVSPRSRGRALGAEEAGIPIGGIIAAALLTFLAVTFSWRIAVMVMAIALAVSGTLFFAVYRDKPSGYTEGRERSKPGRKLPQVAKNRDIWLTSLYGTSFSGVNVAVLTYLVVFLKDQAIGLGLSDGVAGSCLAVAMAGAVIGRFGSGMVSDLLLSANRVVALIFLGILSGVSLALIAWIPSDAPLVLVFFLVFLVGLSTMGGAGLYVALLAELAGPALTGTTMGFSGMVSRVGSFGIAPLFGYAVDRSDSYDVSWWMMVGLAAFGTLLLAFVRPQARLGERTSSWGTGPQA